MTTNLYLIRHGQAYSQLDRPGATPEEVLVGGMMGDRGLTPLGRQQAEHLRDRLAATGEIAADIAIASTMARARETAEIVVPALGVPLLLDDDLHEMRPGEADALSIAEAIGRFGEVNFRVDPYRRFAPSAENYGAFILRAGATLSRITREHAGKTVVLFTHGGVIDASFLVFFQMHTLTPPPAAFYTRNTSITHWAWTEPEHADAWVRGRWRLVRYNDDLHTRDIGQPERIGWVPLASHGAADGRLSVAIPTEEDERPPRATSSMPEASATTEADGRER